MCSFCTRLIDSSPPATMIGTLSTITRCAAIAIACRPDEQKRSTVVPAVVTGSPARSAAWRAMFWPVAPSGSSQPITTSSTSPGSIPARFTAWAMTWPPMAAPCVLLNAPRYARPIGVRAVETMTASAMGLSLCSWGDGNIIPGAMGAHFFAALVVDGALAGTLYALVALSFVVVYRASRRINFAVGEWVMLASRFVTFELHALGLGLLGALAVGCAGMAGLGVAFTREPRGRLSRSAARRQRERFGQQLVRAPPCLGRLRDGHHHDLVHAVVARQGLQPLAALVGRPRHAPAARMLDDLPLPRRVLVRLRLGHRGVTPAAAGVEPRDEEIAALRQPLGDVVALRTHDEDGGAGLRRGQPGRGLELARVGACDLGAAGGVDEVRERERGAEVRGERRRLVARAEQPELWRRRARRHRAHRGERVHGRQLAVHEGDEVLHLFGKKLGHAGAAERPGRELVAARRTADAEIDAAGIERLQHAKALGHLQRAVMLEHDAA